MNKKGNIPIVILVIGVFLVCMIAVLSFSISSIFVRDSFSSIDTVVQASLVKEKISFYENLGYSKEEIKAFLNLQEDERGNLVVRQANIQDISVSFAWP